MPPEEMPNNLMATGALYALLGQVQRPDEFYVEVVMVDGAATNQLRVEFGFLGSTYFITVEREHDVEVGG